METWIRWCPSFPIYSPLFVPVFYQVVQVYRPRGHPDPSPGQCLHLMGVGVSLYIFLDRGSESFSEIFFMQLSSSCKWVNYLTRMGVTWYNMCVHDFRMRERCLKLIYNGIKIKLRLHSSIARPHAHTDPLIGPLLSPPLQPSNHDGTICGLKWLYVSIKPSETYINT